MLLQSKLYPDAVPLTSTKDIVDSNTGVFVDEQVNIAELQRKLTTILGGNVRGEASAAATQVVSLLRRNDDEEGRVNVYLANTGFEGLRAVLLPIIARTAQYGPGRVTAVYGAIVTWIKSTFGPNYVAETTQLWNNEDGAPMVPGVGFDNGGTGRTISQEAPEVAARTFAQAVAPQTFVSHAHANREQVRTIAAVPDGDLINFETNSPAIETQVGTGLGNGTIGAMRIPLTHEETEALRSQTAGATRQGIDFVRQTAAEGRQQNQNERSDARYLNPPSAIVRPSFSTSTNALIAGAATNQRIPEADFSDLGVSESIRDQLESIDILEGRHGLNRERRGIQTEQQRNAREFGYNQERSDYLGRLMTGVRNRAQTRGTRDNPTDARRRLQRRQDFTRPLILPVVPAGQPAIVQITPATQRASTGDRTLRRREVDDFFDAFGPTPQTTPMTTPRMARVAARLADMDDRIYGTAQTPVVGIIAPLAHTPLQQLGRGNYLNASTLVQHPQAARRALNYIPQQRSGNYMNATTRMTARHQQGTINSANILRPTAKVSPRHTPRRLQFVGEGFRTKRKQKRITGAALHRAILRGEIRAGNDNPAIRRAYGSSRR